MLERGTQPQSQPHHLWTSLRWGRWGRWGRWAMLACALVALGAAVLVPRFATTGHAAPAPANTNVSHKPAIFTLTSPTFEANGPLPASAAFNLAGCVGVNGAGQNIPPILTWKNGQTGFTGLPTLSYALTMVDYDAPVGGGFHHWVIYNIPGTVSTLNATTIAESTPGANDFGGVGYGGLCPPQDGQTHHYIFTLYALDIASLSPQGMTYAQLASAINAAVDSNGNAVVNGATILIGTFENP